MNQSVVDWVGHKDGTTAFLIRKPQDTFEDGIWWDTIEKDWERLK